MFFAPSMVKETGLIELVRFPDHAEKAYPKLAVGEIETLCPLLYQFVPDGLTVPAPAGVTAVVKLYWVVKLAV